MNKEVCDSNSYQYTHLRNTPFNILTLGVIAVLYYLLAKFGVYLATLPGSVSLIWPPMGLSLAVVLVLGTWVWPGIFAGAFISSFLGFFNINDPFAFNALIIGFGTGSGSVLCALIGAYLINKYKRYFNPFTHYPDVLRFIIFGALAAQLASTIIGISVYSIAGVLDMSNLVSTFFTWWSGDFVGVLLFTPAIYVFLVRRTSGLIDRRLIEGLLFLLALGIISLYSMDIWPLGKPIYLTLFSIAPIILWGAFRLDQRVTLLGTLLVSIIALLATLNHQGPFIGGDFSESLIELQSFLIVLSLTSLMLNAVLIENKNIQEKLIQSKEKYRMIVENTNEGLMHVDNDQVIQYVNERFCTMTGYSQDELIGKKAFKILLTDIANINMMKARARERTNYITGLYEIQITKKSGELIWLSISGAPIYDKNDNIIGSIGIHSDITQKKQTEIEKRNLEQKLINSQKLESLGRLAGGVAHDFNNILTAIVGYSDMLKLEFKDNTTKTGRAIETIFRNAIRGSNLTKQLLAFARMGKYNPCPLNMNEIIKEILNVSEKIFEKNIDVKLDFEESLQNVIADKNQMAQVFTNIFINAKDSMVNGGKLMIKTRNIIIKTEDSLDLAALSGKAFVEIVIADTGKGMAPAIKDKIFDPFFTTKEQGKGTGLGLATVYGIIDNHQGKIICESEVNIGTRLKIYLPVTKKKIFKSSKKRKSLKTGTETILLVDDEETVRNLVSDLLKYLGYSVYVAENGKIALNLYKDRQKEIDLVMLDMIMPVMAGKETFYKLRKINKDIPILLISGYSKSEKAAELLNDGAVGFLSKPFQMQDLSIILSKILTAKK